jgi:diguanylate cyclase (GGDEF)-like protein/PAS domain S-box-containing protein
LKAYHAFQEKLLSAFILACLIVLTLTAIALQMARNASEVVTSVQHTYEVLNSIIRARADTIEIELSTQSYRITGDVKKLAVRDKVILARDKSLQRIQLATLDNHSQQLRLKELGEVIDQRLAISNHIILLSKTQGSQAADAYVATTTLQETRDRMYKLLFDLESEERQLLSQRIIKQDKYWQVTGAALLFIGLLLSGFLILTFLIIRKQFKDNYLSRKQLAESELRLSTTLQSIGEGVVTTDLDGYITRMNPTAEKLTGWQFTDVQGRPVEEVLNVVNELTRQPTKLPIEKAILTGEIQVLEKDTALIDRKGNARPIMDSAAPIIDPGGIIRGVVVVFRDASLERQAERVTKHQNEQLEKKVQERTLELHTSEKNLRSVTDNVPALIAYLDAHQRYIYANQKYLDRFAPENKSIIGLTVRKVLGNERYAIAESYINQVLTGLSISYDWQPFPNVWQMVNYVPTKNTKGAITGYYVLISDISDRKLAESELNRLTHFDPLTGLANETQFTHFLYEAIQSGKFSDEPFAFLQINVEKLSEINDALGFSKGDLVLQEFAERLKLTSKALYKLARLRGDEFAILINNCSATEAIAMANQLKTSFNIPIVISNIALDVSAKIGIAMFPEHGITPHDLYRHADSAVRQAKNKGELFQMFDYTLDSDKPHRLALAAELRHAIDHNDLELYLQPKIDFKTGQVCSLEALIRWNHSERGMVSPIQFIPLAEQIGLIKPLTQWVMDTALQLLHSWEMSGFIMPIAINLSTSNLKENDLVERVHQLKTKWKVSAELLEIEVTESSIMEDGQHALKVLQSLREEGISISIDDFGTGYSSLSYLQKLPAKFIKIDQSFVRDMLINKESLMIVRSTIDLAHDLDKKVVAEGVETREQWDQLAKLGCDIAQGYYFAKPMPVDVFLSWIKDFKFNVVL